MKEGRILMRVLFWKIQWPFMCFCKPSAAAHHLYTTSVPLKLENGPRVVVPSTTAFDVSNTPEKSSSEECVNGMLKSCLRKFPYEPHDNNKEVVKKKVQWIDMSGKELAEIKEFESSETGDTDSEEESSRCLCNIL